MRYYNQGPLSSPGGWATTSLSLALPFTGTNWEVDIEGKYSLDWGTSGNYTGPSVPTQNGTSSGAQGPQVIVSFDPVTASDRSALTNTADFADFERVIDAWYGSNDLSASYNGTSVSNLVNPADGTIQNNIADGTYWYQIIRNGGTLTMNYSYDGVHYFTALSAPLADPSSSYNELLLSGLTYSTAGSFTDYSFVTIESPTPEPSTLLPLSLCILGAGVGWLRRRTAKAGAPPRATI